MMVSLALLFVLGNSSIGCRSHYPIETAHDVRTLGSIVDELNQTQEENAEAAKFTIYLHEFEINAAPIDVPQFDPGFGVQNQSPHGYRLTPAGQDHVREIARQMIRIQGDGQGGHTPTIRVVVERSDTSKLASTVYQYPVHYNAQLDAVRRQIVVSALQRLGVSWADPCVIVAPAYATGLNAAEAATAYQRAFGVRGQSNGGAGGRSGLGGTFSTTGGPTFNP